MFKCVKLDAFSSPRADHFGDVSIANANLKECERPGLTRELTRVGESFYLNSNAEGLVSHSPAHRREKRAAKTGDRAAERHASSRE